jgi:hypothetical protein
MEVRRCVEFTNVKLASGAKLTAPVEKDETCPVENAIVGRFGGEDRDCGQQPR